MQQDRPIAQAAPGQVDPLDAMDIGQAMQLLRCGLQVARHGWTPEGPRFLFYTPSRKFHVLRDTHLGDACPRLVGQDVWRRAHISARMANGDIAFWQATQDDLLACDWTEVLR